MDNLIISLAKWTTNLGDNLQSYKSIALDNSKLKKRKKRKAFEKVIPTELSLRVHPSSSNISLRPLLSI